MQSAMCLAISHGDLEDVTRLLDAGADINESFNVYSQVSNPLCFAIHTSMHMHSERGLPLIQLLLERNANTEFRSGHTGCTPLIMAGILGSVGAVNLLIAHGANLFNHDQYGSTALQRTFWLSMVLIGPYERRRQVVQILKDEMDRAWFESSVVQDDSRNLAVAMGHHSRLGASSHLSNLDPGVLQMIAMYTEPDHWRREYYD
jgi:hypothetical protein